jgi:hypothetical protein
MLVVIGALALITIEPASRSAGLVPALPLFKGLNYGVPLTASGQWVGTAWLRDDHWAQVKPAMAADLDFIEQHHLGRVIRLFIGLDQLMLWDRANAFAGFNPSALANLGAALDLFDTHHFRVVAVLFDQEVVGSPGNFRYQALDGDHEAMRTGYLRAAHEFLRAMDGRSTISAVDLFNEAYSSLGTAGHLPLPPAPDPVSPRYSVATVHAFLRDLYVNAKRAQPAMPVTVSDATLYWQPQPDLSLYDDVLDFYDVHVYDDHPDLSRVKHALDKPFMIGEAGAAVSGRHYTDQAVEAVAVRAILEQGLADGARAVLVHSIANQNVFPATRDRLTATGEVLSRFGAPPRFATNSALPIVLWPFPLVLFVTSRAGRYRAAGRRGRLTTHSRRELRWDRPPG